jgi:hypothetical protein
MDEDRFPNSYDNWDRGVAQPVRTNKRLSTDGAFCPNCHVVMVPGGGCFTCPLCGGTNAKCGG